MKTGFTVKPHILAQLQKPQITALANALGLTENAMKVRIRINTPDGPMTKVSFLYMCSDLIADSLTEFKAKKMKIEEMIERVGVKEPAEVETE